ncbi:MAG: HlyD family efflux transporter periplasmic adaptor subunit [Verrucomicrobiales bacterium]|nr:HlyD family efflux transporter periplasmic adaptor subunit [Verrucomicrobiales bacterium]
MPLLKTLRSFLVLLILTFPVSLHAEKPEKKATKATKATKAERAGDKAGVEQKKAEGGEDAGEEEPKTHEVVAEKFVLKTKVSGVVESTRATPVAPDLDQWSDLTVVTAVDHGTVVKKGDVLIELATEDIKEKIRDLDLGMPLKELARQEAHLELDKLEKTTPLTLDRSRKLKSQAEADLAYYEDITKEIRERDAKETVASAENYLAYAQEELDQLLKMYEEDDLTEETEEIILQRARHSVKNYEWLLEKAKERADRSLTTTIPREHEKLKQDLELHQINWRAGERSTRDALTKKRQEVAAMDRDFEESVKSLNELRKDLEAMSVEAPHDGIVYYGMAQRGKWTTASTVERKLLPGAKLTMREVVMTVVDPAKVQLRAAASETSLKDLKVGQSAETEMKWNSEVKLKGKITSLSFVPFSTNTFDMVVSLPPAPKGKPVMPGMAATAEVITYENEKALTVPKAAIKKEGDKESVTLKGGKVRRVETGKTDGKKVEILKGLKAGDVIELPAAEKKDAPAKSDSEAKPEADSKPGAKAKS